MSIKLITEKEKSDLIESYQESEPPDESSEEQVQGRPFGVIFIFILMILLILYGILEGIRWIT